MKSITVRASKTYDVIIGKNILVKAGTIIRKTVGGKAAVTVMDDNVAKIYGEKLSNSLAAASYHTLLYIFPHGESSKNTKTFVSLLNFLAKKKITRTDVVIALGGGVTGDLAGFAAACYMRGIRFVQMPTTLLAAVDSSVGGKTAVDLTAGKNLAGAFYQPDLVLCDVSVLSTLPATVFRDGCAEVIKHGMIADKVLFNLLKVPIQAQMEKIIARNVKIKSGIITEDEFEKDRRKLLNFGHSVGHAIELLSGYSLSHGQAVAAGMAIITRAAFRMGLCGKKCLSELLQMLERYNLPVNTKYKAGAIAKACLSDKKRDGDIFTLVFPLKIGTCILKNIPVNDLEKVIQYGLEES